MEEGEEIGMPHVGLQTAQHEELLNIIDTLRSQGISRYIDLPQLIVCGDQSSGKSSVLEAISGLRFPTKDNLCTRFAIELILRRGPSRAVTITIIPGEDRTERESSLLASFKPPSTSVDDFANIVSAAEKAMDLDGSNRAFAKDILRVELCGPKQPHLTLFDLPGIFWAGDQSQSDEDAKIVRSLVESYMKKTRSIILAVVSAKSDLAMQIITKLARSDSESAFVKLAKNENIYFKLGWHVLKNRDYDTRNSTTIERDLAESNFFEQNVWSSALRSTQLGISNLRRRLSKVLLNQILRELPSLMSDFENGLGQCKRRLEMLGGSRSTVSAQRAYLVQASQTFVELMAASVDGKYSHSFFGSSSTEEGYGKRLRAVVQCTLKGFAEQMRLKGHAVEIVDTLPNSAFAVEGGDPILILRDRYLEQVQHRMTRSRGRELPGLFNPDIIDDLFYDQAKPWQGIMVATLERLVDVAETAIKYVLEEAADTATVDGIMGFLVRPNFEPIKAGLLAKASEILEPHLKRRLLTFNHYFTDTLQKMRHEEVQKAMAGKLHLFFGVDPKGQEMTDRWYDTGFDVAALLKSLTIDIEADMDRFAAIEATNAMEAYYKVALKTVIDTFGMYAIESCLLTKLTDVFNPTVVLNLDDATISRVAAESDESVAEREDLTKKLKVLDSTMKTMQQLRTILKADALIGRDPAKPNGSNDTGTQINGGGSVITQEKMSRAHPVEKPAATRISTQKNIPTEENGSPHRQINGSKPVVLREKKTKGDPLLKPTATSKKIHREKASTGGPTTTTKIRGQAPASYLA